MGSVVFSVDAELGWGFSDHEEPPASRVDAARAGWRTLLDVFDAHHVASTWAVVGHLFLDDYDGVYADHPAVEGGFEHEAGTWLGRPELRFGSDLVEEIREATVDHELACHSFSHVLFGARETTRAIARAELELSIEVAGAVGVEFESFVFPRNAVGHRDLLAEFGFRCYRGARATSDNRLRRVAEKLVATAGVTGVDLAEPMVDEYGLVDVAPSLYLFGFEGWPRRVATSLWDDPVVGLAKRGIDRASREDGLFHLWLHPNNLRTDRDVERVRRIVAHAAARRDGTDLTIETMADVAARVVDREPAEAVDRIG